jgi:hypothetical protein
MIPASAELPHPAGRTVLDQIDAAAFRETEPRAAHYLQRVLHHLLPKR